MYMIDNYKQRQLTRINGIQKDPILKSIIQQAHGDDEVSLAEEDMGTFHRLNALLKMYPIEKIHIIEHTYKKGILYPLNNLALASAYLADFDFQNRLYKGIDYAREGVLDHAALLTQDTCWKLHDSMMLKDSSFHTDDIEFCLANMKIFAYALPYVSLFINTIGRRFPSTIEDTNYWKEEESVIIAKSVEEGTKQYKKEEATKIADTDITKCIANIIEKHGIASSRVRIYER